MSRALRFLFTVGLFIGSGIIAAAQAPTANFSATPLSSCTPLIVQFTDLSTDTPTSWSWNLGNGTSSSLRNPSTTYTTPGTYTVTLTVSNASGSHTKTATNYITVAPAPTVNFVVNDSSAGCGTKTVTVTNLSNPNTTGATIYYWDFGDGFTTSAQNPPAHTYTVPGTYNISLVVTNGSGCTNSLLKTGYITVLPKPVAGFTATNTNACAAPVTTSFSNTSTGAVSYAWDFGDGNTSTSASPSHTYTTAGSYTVRLITTSAGGCKDTMTKVAFVNIGTITAGFGASTISTCTRNPITFTNTSTPSGSGSVWSFGDGNTSTQTNPVHSYTTPGTYTVKLVVAYSTCSDSATKTITVTSGPAAGFSASPLAGCKVPHTVNFTNSSSGATSYLWLFGNGGSSTSTSPAYTYTSLGTYTVKLVAISSNGCRDTVTKNSHITIDTPRATINTNPYPGCAPATANFNAMINSVIPVASYSWAYGDGGTGTGGPGSSHVYTTAGTYTVTLTMVTTTGCVFTATQNIVVGARTSPGFTANPTTACVKSGVAFTNTTTGGATNYLWLFGDGGTSTQVNPVYTYGAPGIYTVRLISSNYGCTDTFTRTNYITVTPPKAAFVSSYACANRKMFTFTNNSIGATSYLWTFGDGSTDTAANPVHTYANYGTLYTVRLVAYSSLTGCTDTVYGGAYADPMVMAFTSDTVLCKGATTVFSATPGYRYYWDFGDGSPTPTNIYDANQVHRYTASGTYTVRLIMMNGQLCADTLVKTNYVKVHAPTASFTQTPNAGCGQLSVTFTDNSTPSSGRAITSRIWDFGDGSTLTTTSTTVNHTYSLAGSYSVRLIAIETGGCPDTAFKPNVIIVNRPVAAFTSPVIGCKNGVTNFTNASTGNGALSYRWFFGDGDSSTATNPSHIYTATGTYTVRLIVKESTGCSDTVTKLNYINVSAVQSAFTMSDSAGPCAPFTVSFTNSSVGAVSYLWVFGNGGTSTLANPSAAFTTSGTFNVKLIAINANGCRDTSSRSIVIGTGPSGSFSYTPFRGCSPMSMVFSATASGHTSLTFDFGNGVTTTTTSNSVSYTYTQPGMFRPTLIISNANGCNTFVLGSDSIFVSKAYAAFSVGAAAPACVGAPVQFNDGSTAAVSSVNSRSWSFGDGGTSTATNPTHTYAAAGTYSVRLVVTTNTGCSDTAYRNVTINPLPVVTVPSQTVCGGNPVQLNASGAATYSWSPATALSCTTCASPFASPTSTTTYTITGTSAAGCVGTGTTTVTVTPSPTVSAGSAVAICAGSSTTLSATGATSYVWSPSTGLSCTTCASPSASPTTTTTYTVIGTTNGCPDTASVTVTVNPIPVLTVSPGQNICAGSSASMTASGATSYSWSPATGLSCTTCASPTASPSTTTTYTVTGTTDGCSATATTTVTVTPIPLVTIAANSTICINGATTLTASGATSYSWSPATGLSCTNCANPSASPTSTTTYTVTGTTSGCSGTATHTLTVNPLPVVTAGADRAICAGASTTLSASGATSYSWSPATGLSSATAASPVASPTITTTYVVSGTDANGCQNTDTIIVTVNPLPLVSAGSNTSVCPGGSANLSGSGAASYSWSPATGLSCTTCANPVATPTATTTYKVVGTSADGCIDSATVTVAVNNVPVVTVSGADTICIGGSTSLSASGANSFSWSPATGLSCSTCPNPVANPTVTTTYTITGTSGVGCTGTASFTVVVNPLPMVSAGADTSICAGTSTTLTASGAASYSWSPATGLSCTNCAAPSASPAATSTYVVTGTSTTGCVNTDTVVVTVLPKPIVSAGSNTAICPGGSATLGASGAATYSWSPATGLSCTACASPVASPSATTTYTVTGTSADGCSDTASVTVAINLTPAVSVTGTDSICIGGSTALTASGANSFSWSPATGLSCTNCANPTANPTATTTYTVTGTSGVGCTGTTTITVRVNPLPTVSAGADTAICTGASATLTASGAATYTWSPSTGLSTTAGSSVTATPTSTITYTVTGVSSSGCVNTDNVTVTVNPLPVISAGSNTSICPGGSATLGASGGATYSWSPATSLSCTNCASPVASPATTTTYTVTGTSVDGCSSTSSVTVTVNQTPTISVSGVMSICEGASTTLTASGAGSFSWSPATNLSATTGATVTANPPVTTTYTVTGTSGVGCTGTTTVTVTVNPLPAVNAGPDVTICAGTSTVLTASGAGSYIWSPATGLSTTTTASTTASPLVTSVYTVTGTSAAGCTNTDNVMVTVDPQPAVSAGNNTTICIGGSTTLNATGAASYAWTPGATLSCTTCASPVATPAVTTTYTVIGTGNNGCLDTATVTVSVSQLPAVAVTGNTTVCLGASTVLTASGASSYVWSPSTGLSCSTCASPTATPTATTTYTVTGTSGIGCTSVTTVTVTVNPLPVITVDTPQTVCLNTPVQLTAGGAATYSWSPATGLSCTTCANPVATPAATTTYTVTGTDLNGCSSLAQTTISILALPTVSAGPDVATCKLDSVKLQASGADSYVWTPAAGLSCTTCSDPMASPAVSSTYVVTGTAANGCTANDTVNVNLHVQPPVNAGPDQRICSGQSAQLQASGASIYVWSPATGLSCTTCANPLSTPDSTITYMVHGTDVNGCHDSDLVTITVIQRMPVDIDSGGSFCIGGSMQLHASGGDSYTWTPSAGLSCTDCSSPVATPDVTTTYNVIVRQSSCFADTLSVTVVVHPLPTVNAGPDQSIILGTPAQIRVTGTDISEYSWSPAHTLSCSDCANPLASPPVNTTYIVTVTSEAGCTASDDIRINVRCDGTQVWMPNTFTPNADGQNDFFYPHGKGLTQITRFRIYDRWGELIFDRMNMPVNDRNAGWDGTYKNQALKPDVFVWILNATCTNGEPLELKGDISLIR